LKINLELGRRSTVVVVVLGSRNVWLWMRKWWWKHLRIELCQRNINSGNWWQKKLGFFDSFRGKKRIYVLIAQGTL